MKTILETVVEHIKKEYFLKKFDNWDDLVIKVETCDYKTEVTIKDFKSYLDEIKTEEEFDNSVCEYVKLFIPLSYTSVDFVIRAAVSCKMLAALVVFVGKEV